MNGPAVDPPDGIAMATWLGTWRRRGKRGTLRRLRRDRVELLLLHEPIAGQFEREKWRQWLESEKSRGRIGDYGIAVAPSRLATFLTNGERPLGVVQAHDSLENCEAQPLLDHGRPLQITFGYIAGALKAGRSDVVDVLKSAMQRNCRGAVVVSTRRAERIAAFGEAQASMARL